MPLITVFSAPKPFTNPHIATIQRNAIQSWLQLGKEVEVFLVGEEEGLPEIADEYHVKLLSDVQRNDAGTPLVSSIFNLAREQSTSPYMLYVNGDIILLPDIIKATKQVAAQLKSFLIIGQRWDLDVREPLDFSGDWAINLQQKLAQHGKLHPPAGSDYFIFPKDAFQEMPDFAIGRAGWDNWMIYAAIKQGWHVIDATPSITIIHQNHDYSHLPGGKPHYTQAESIKNLETAGGQAHMYMILDTDRQLVNGEIRRPSWTTIRTLRTLERWFMPPDGTFKGIRGKTARRFRRMRKKLSRSNDPNWN